MPTTPAGSTGVASVQRAPAHTRLWTAAERAWTAAGTRTDTTHNDPARPAKQTCSICPARTPANQEPGASPTGASDRSVTLLSAERRARLACTRAGSG
jgi:hypothetical protein